MPRHSTVQLPPADHLESNHYLVDGQHRIVAVRLKTSREPSKVVTASFGEWPTPTSDHADSRPIGAFVAELESQGYGEGLKEARKSIAGLLDKKTTLRSLRLHAGLSQEQLASLMETSQPQIARMESGKQDLQLSTLRRFAVVLKIDLHAVVDACQQ